MLHVATAMRDIFDVPFFTLMFYTAFLPGFRHFYPSLCFDTGSPSSLYTLKVTLIGSAVYRELVFSTVSMICIEIHKVFHSCLSDENGCNKFYLKMHMETTESPKNST